MEHIQQTLKTIERRNAGEPEFLQAATEVLESVRPVIERNKVYQEAKILERILIQLHPKIAFPFHFLNRPKNKKNGPHAFMIIESRFF